MTCEGQGHREGMHTTDEEAFDRKQGGGLLLLPDRGTSNGLGTNQCIKIALGFGSDWVDSIEQNRRRSSATSKILRLRVDPRWPEDKMRVA
jgi:hypothetical protein